VGYTQPSHTKRGHGVGLLQPKTRFRVCLGFYEQLPPTHPLGFLGCPVGFGVAGGGVLYLVWVSSGFWGFQSTKKNKPHTTQLWSTRFLGGPPMGVGPGNTTPRVGLLTSRGPQFAGCFSWQGVGGVDSLGWGS